MRESRKKKPQYTAEKRNKRKGIQRKLRRSMYMYLVVIEVTHSTLKESVYHRRTGSSNERLLRMNSGIQFPCSFPPVSSMR